MRLDIRLVHGVDEHGHTFDGRRRRDAVPEVRNVARFAELADHRFGECLQFLLGNTKLEEREKTYNN